MTNPPTCPTWMTRTLRLSAVVPAILALATVLTGGPTQALAQGGTGLPADAVTALRRGGHVLLLRHTTTVTVAAPSPLDLTDCANQHRLTDGGREEARAIGAGVRALGIPVGQILVSPYCRTIETAQLAFAQAGSREDALLHPLYQPLPGLPVPPPYEQRIERVKRLLASAPAAGTNSVLVTHGEVAVSALGFAIAQGEAVVHRPDGRGGTAIVARILPDGWAAAVAAAGASAPSRLPSTGGSGGTAALAIPAVLGLLGSLGLARMARRRRAA